MSQQLLALAAWHYTAGVVPSYGVPSLTSSLKRCDSSSECRLPDRSRSVDRYIRLWLDDDLTRTERWRRAAKGIFHNRVPRKFRFWAVVHWFCRNALAASGPAVAFYYGSVTRNTAYIAALALFLASAVVWFFGLLADRKSQPDETEALVRFGDLLSALKTTSATNANRGDAIKACLGILQIFGRRIAKTEKEDLAVSLIVYEGNSTSKMMIRHRNPGSTRPVNRQIDAVSVLGHHACQKDGAPRVLHDTKDFKGTLRSPTQSKVDYRSILVIPISVTSQNGVRVKGFVSIDCRRPYAFYGNRSDEIVVTCQPIIDQLSVLLKRE